MKKEYQKPDMRVVELHAQNTLLAGSMTQSTETQYEFDEGEELY